MLPLTVIILTKDEEPHIARCLGNVAGHAAQVIVVDSESADRTVAIAKERGAEVVTHPFTTQAEQFNWALDNVEIRGDWVLRLDADEYLLPELWEEIERVLPRAPAEVSGFLLKRRMYFMGRWVRHGGYYPVRLLRLFRRADARSTLREMDEHIELLRGRTMRLRNDFVDWSVKGVGAWTAKHAAYAAREVAAMLRERDGKDSALPAGGPARAAARRRGIYRRLPLFWRSGLYFLYRYVLRLGFLDGVPGLVFHFLHAFWYRFLIDAEWYEATRKDRIVR